MRKVAEALFYVVLTAWVGGLWVIGYFVAPVLFASLGDRQLAGMVAGGLFRQMGWFGLACGAYLSAYLLVRLREMAFRRPLFWLVVALLALSAVSLFCIQPLMAQLKADVWPKDVIDSALRDRFMTWHVVSRVVYLLQSGLGLWLVVSSSRELK